MQAALTRLQEAGQPLRRWPGGWWGTVGSPLRKFDSYDVPVPDFSTQTVAALERRGLIRRAHVRPQWWQDDFVLAATEARP